MSLRCASRIFSTTRVIQYVANTTMAHRTYITILGDVIARAHDVSVSVIRAGTDRFIPRHLHRLIYGVGHSE
jgi:hypothetical protein